MSLPPRLPARPPSAAMRPDPAGRGVTRRSMLRGAVALGAAPLLASCSGGGGGGRERIRFVMNKPEVVEYFGTLVEEFNASQDSVLAVLDSTPTSLTAQVVRGAPPDIACYNYNLEASTFVARGVLTDLSDLPEASTVDPAVQALVGQFASYRDETNVLPFSITAAGVIYNKQLFADNGVAVPTTWTELIAACETFKAAGVDPLYATYREGWTTQQGLFDYATGGAVDVAAFYEKLQAEGTDFEPGSPTSFSTVMEPAVEKMLQLASYANSNAASRNYYDGNLAFGQGQAAMYLQGPWALGEIAKVDPDLAVGTFALPMTDDPADTKVRVNLDLAVWIPRAGTKQAAARTLLRYLMQPEVVNAYNAANLAYSPLRDAPAQPDERVAPLQQYVDEGRFYQGAGTYIPPTVPVGNYLQDAVISRDGERFLRTLDDDWRRLALRSA